MYFCWPLNNFYFIYLLHFFSAKIKFSSYFNHYFILAQEVDLSALYSCVNKHRAEPVPVVPVVSYPENVLYHEPEINNGYEDEEALYCQPEEFMRPPIQTAEFVQEVCSPEMTRNKVYFF